MFTVFLVGHCETFHCLPSLWSPGSRQRARSVALTGPTSLPSPHSRCNVAPATASSTSPYRPLPDPDGSEWRHWNSPGQATREPAVDDRDHRFSVGYPSFKKEG